MNKIILLNFIKIKLLIIFFLLSGCKPSNQDIERWKEIPDFDFDEKVSWESNEDTILFFDTDIKLNLRLWREFMEEQINEDSINIYNIYKFIKIYRNDSLIYQEDSLEYRLDKLRLFREKKNITLNIYTRKGNEDFFLQLIKLR
ncbi:MAG: hypothetical protein NW226_00575 [Microscillaceae bacterium]|nr:hypothetical protein [Microscillaceae bacterium]